MENDRQASMRNVDLKRSKKKEWKEKRDEGIKKLKHRSYENMKALFKKTASPCSSAESAPDEPDMGEDCEYS